MCAMHASGLVDYEKPSEMQLLPKAHRFGTTTTARPDSADVVETFALMDRRLHGTPPRVYLAAAATAMSNKNKKTEKKKKGKKNRGKK
jgi:hypothetical protein